LVQNPCTSRNVGTNLRQSGPNRTRSKSELSSAPLSRISCFRTSNEEHARTCTRSNLQSHPMEGTHDPVLAKMFEKRGSRLFWAPVA
jgi:hypothetical protein